MNIFSTALDPLAGSLNALYLRRLKVNPTSVLNDGPGRTSLVPMELGFVIRDTVNRLRAVTYDSASNTFDYARAQANPSYAELRAATALLNTFDPTALTTDAEKSAFWLNLYNALILDAVITFQVKETVWRDPGFFRRAAYRIRGIRTSADEIEHGILRRNAHPPYLPFAVFRSKDPRVAWQPSQLDPRLHCALNCAARSCPPIAAYDAVRLDAQLELAARSFVNATTHVEPDALHLSPIFKWYAPDFDGRAGVIRFIKRYLEPRAWAPLRGTNTPHVMWAKYDWRLNSS